VTPQQNVFRRHFLQAFHRRLSKKGARNPKGALLRPLFE
jgi:hypothetical protein